MAKARKSRLSVSWDTGPGAVDVRALLERLSETKGGHYSQRPLAEIAGMVLAKYLPQEVKLCGG